MATDARQRLGEVGEDHAAAHFARLGYEIVARRHRTRFGELDLVTRLDDVLVFCEVKTRRGGGGHPFEKLDGLKQAQVRRMAVAWLHDTVDRPYFDSLRFDAVGVIIDREGRLMSLEHLEGAF